MPELFSEYPLARSAEFSPCRRYRYMLKRAWDAHSARVMFVGLNPSTADETNDDPTIRRCIGFARAWGHGGIYMLNLFAFRATQPKDMRAAADPVGPENDEFLYRIAHRSTVIVAAWGKQPGIQERVNAVCEVLAHADQPIYCLGVNQDGSPKHPLYLPKTAKLVPWSMEVAGV